MNWCVQQHLEVLGTVKEQAITHLFSTFCFLSVRKLVIHWHRVLGEFAPQNVRDCGFECRAELKNKNSCKCFWVVKMLTYADSCSLHSRLTCLSYKQTVEGPAGVLWLPSGVPAPAIQRTSWPMHVNLIGSVMDADTLSYLIVFFGGTESIVGTRHLKQPGCDAYISLLSV